MKSIAFIVAVFFVGIASAQTVVNSTWLYGDGNYSNPANWSPAEVPNNTADRSYNVTVPAPMSPNIEATVSNLTINDSVIIGHDYTVTGQTTVNHYSTTPGGVDLLVEFAGQGSPVRFQTGTLENDGLIDISGAILSVTESFANYDSATKTLNGGSYIFTGAYDPSKGTSIPARLSFPGADIVHNAAAITFANTGSKIVDENGNDALRNFAENEPSGTFELQIDASFSTSSDFRNRGTVNLFGAEVPRATINVPAGHVYLQTDGVTQMRAGAINGDVEIDGGELDVPGGGASFLQQTSKIIGNVTVSGGVVNIGELLVNGSVQLSGAARLHYTANVPNAVRMGLIVSGTLTLGGNLEVDYPSPFPPGSGTPFFIASANTITGNFANAPIGSRVTTTDGAGSFLVGSTTQNGQQFLLLTDYQRTVPAAQLMNISTRAQVLTGDNVEIGGFIITGYESMNVIVRAIGPSLAGSGVSGALQDPTIELHDGKGAVIATNDNWSDTQAGDVVRSGLAPGDYHDSAIVATLQPGSYTVVVRGKNDTTGVALLEVYDLSKDAHAKLANISTRGFVDANNPLIGGFIAGGNGQGDAELTVRAIGSGLQFQKVANFLADPALEVRDSNGTVVASNDNFVDPQENVFSVPAELALFNSKDAATGLIVPPGAYTVVVHGKNGATGNALVEIYDLNR